MRQSNKIDRLKKVVIVDLSKACKDIICYKMVEKTKIKGVYKSSFQKFEYVIRQLYINNFDIKFSYFLIKHTSIIDSLSE